MKKTSSYVFLFAKDYRTTTSGWQGAPYFRKYDQKLVSTGDFSEEKLGGYRRTTQNPINSLYDLHGPSITLLGASRMTWHMFCRLNMYYTDSAQHTMRTDTGSR